MSAEPLRVAVITGGHGYNVIHFHELFGGLTDIKSYIQHMDDFASSSEVVRDTYDVVLFFCMLQEGPSDEGQPWYAGQPKTALEHLGVTGQGLFVLHHALLAYPQSSVWNGIVGVADRHFGHHKNQPIHVNAATDHPVTKGISDWDMVEETYTMADAGPDSQILLTVEHEKSMRTIGWARHYKNSRVFCFQPGHNHRTWNHPSFVEILRRGIHWCGRRI